MRGAHLEGRAGGLSTPSAGVLGGEDPPSSPGSMFGALLRCRRHGPPDMVQGLCVSGG